jgi:hypothetical protein
MAQAKSCRPHTQDLTWPLFGPQSTPENTGTGRPPPQTGAPSPAPCLLPSVHRHLLQAGRVLGAGCAAESKTDHASTPAMLTFQGRQTHQKQDKQEANF